LLTSYENSSLGFNGAGVDESFKKWTLRLFSSVSPFYELLNIDEIVDLIYSTVLSLYSETCSFVGI